MSNVMIFSDCCKGVDDCFICSFVCPHGLFEPSKKMNSQGYLPSRIKDEFKCTGCANCMISCPDMAIVVQTEREEAHDQA